MSELERIIASSRRELAERRAATDEPTLAAAARTAAAADPRRDFAAALQRPGLSVIAEHKRRSPSAGSIREDLTLESVVRAYERGGAAALSVLTEAESFGGRLEDLGHARRASGLPLLRKDFLVEAYQLHEAVLAGADAVLLIVAALSREDLARLHDTAVDLGLAALVEVHDARELSLAAAIGARIIGVNNRDLATLQVDTRRTFELLEGMPPGCLVVAESGFRTAAQLQELRDAGVDAVLIGEALMRSPDLEAELRTLLGSPSATP